MSRNALWDGPKRRRGALVGSLAALGVVLALSMPLVLREAPGQVQRTPGGGVLELRGWTYGRTHTFVDGTGWQRLLRRIGLRQPQFGGYVGEASTGGNDALVLWFRWITPPRADEELQAIWQTAWIDAHGCTIRADHRWPNWVQSPFENLENQVSGQRFVATAPVSFPDRGATYPGTLPRDGSERLTYALLRLGHKQPLATFTVPTVGGVRETWTPTPLPARATQGDTTFVLQRLRHHALTAEYPLQRTTAEFRYEGADAQIRNWMPAVAWVEDGWGNVLIKDIGTPQHDRATFDSLCLREPAWKLRFAFVRCDPLLVKPDQVLRIRDLSIDGQARTMKAAGVGELTCTATRAGKYAWIQLCGTPPDAGQLTLLAAADGRGHSLLAGNGGRMMVLGPPRGPRAVGNSGVTTGSFFFPLPATKRFDLTLGVYRPRVAEYLVRP